MCPVQGCRHVAKGDHWGNALVRHARRKHDGLLPPGGEGEWWGGLCDVCHVALCTPGQAGQLEHTCEGPNSNGALERAAAVASKTMHMDKTEQALKLLTQFGYERANPVDAPVPAGRAPSLQDVPTDSAELAEVMASSHLPSAEQIADVLCTFKGGAVFHHHHVSMIDCAFVAIDQNGKPHWLDYLIGQ